jgi:hypothetical protein
MIQYLPFRLIDELALEWTMQIRKSIHKYEHHPAWKPFITIWLGLLGLAATIAQPGDVTERPVKKLSEASDLLHWPEGFAPKQTDAFVHNQIGEYSQYARLMPHDSLRRRKSTAMRTVESNASG